MFNKNSVDILVVITCVLLCWTKKCTRAFCLRSRRHSFWIMHFFWLWIDFFSLYMLVPEEFLWNIRDFLKLSSSIVCPEPIRLIRPVFLSCFIGINRVWEYSFWFLPIHRCVLALYTQYFPESCEKKTSQACYSGGIRTHDPCNSRAVSHQLDYRGCLVARGSLNAMFRQLVPQRYKRC